VASVYKVLAQSNPSASTLTTAYTVPADRATVLSTVVITNFGPSPASYRIAIRPAGASITQPMYIAYDITVPALDASALTLGLTLATTDVVSVYSSSGLVNFNIFGSEIS
jgi:hypothetical protein